MPLAPVNPAVGDQEEDPTLPPKPRIGTTGGEIPEQQSDIDARRPVKWQADPMARKAQVQEEITKRRQANFQKDHPFTPSGWQPKINTPETRRQDREFESDAESQYQFQEQSARATEIERRRQEIAARNANNNQLEAQYRGSGQKFYADADQNLQPVIDTETGRPLFDATGWEAGTHPKTGKPTLSMRDRFGQRQFKEPPIVQSLDPHDDQMHYKLPDGTTVAAGSIDDFAKSPNYAVAKTALAAKTRQVKAVHQEALQPIRLMADQAVAQLEDAKVEIQGLDAEIEKLSTQVGNATSPNGSPTPLSEGLRASLAQLQARRDKIDGMIKPRGELAQRAARAKSGYAIASATAMREAFLSQQNEIAARVKAQGGNLETDPTYQANLRGLRSAEQILGTGEQQAGGGPVAPGGAPSQESAPGAAPGLAPTSPLEQSEPFAASQNGVKSVGSVKMDEFARRYGDGRGPVQPASLLKLDKRSKEIEGVLANDDTSLNQTMRDQFTAEKDYIDSLFKQRFARMTPEQQKRVTDATRDPTLGEKAEEFGGQAVASVEKTFTQAAKGVLKLGDVGIYKADTSGARAALDKIEARADTFGAQGAPAEVKQKLEESFATGTLPGAIGSAASFMVPGSVVGKAGKVLQLSERALQGFTAAGVAATGAASNSEAFAQEAQKFLQPKLDAGEISREEYETSLGMARVFGGAVGATEAIPLGKFAQRLGGVPTGQGFLQKLFTIAGKGGTQRAAKWLTGGAGKEALTEALEEGGQELIQSLAQDLYASETFDENRKVGGDAAEQAGAGGIVGALLSVITHKLGKGGKPKPGAPAAPVEPAAPPSTPASTAITSQQEAEAAFQAADAALASEADTEIARINKGIRDQADAKPASESAEVFAKTATGKPAIDSADVFTQTEEAYQKDPIRADPDRRIKELNAEIEKLDADWAAHVAKVGAEAADAPRKQALDDRKAAIEAELAAADAVRQSPQGAAALKGELATEEQTAAADARRLATPELESRRDAIEQGLAEQERTKKSPAGAEGLKKGLAAEAETAAADARKLRTPDLEGRRDAIETQLTEAERVRQSAKGGADLKNDLAARSGEPPSAPPTQPAPPTAPSPLGDQPVKMELRRGNGEIVEMEMPARVAEKRINDHISTLDKVMKCLGGLT